MSTRRLILLTGLHKTGTTAIQRTCASHWQLLRRQGVFYPPSLTFDVRFEQGRDGNHSRLLRTAFRSESILQYQREDPALVDRYRQLSLKVRNGLLSRLRGTQARTVLMLAEAISIFKPADLEDLIDACEGLDYAIEAYCCVRQPSAWTASLVAQRVAGRSGQRMSLAAALQEVQDQDGLLVPRVRRLAEAFPRLKVYSFAAAIRHPQGPAGFFLQESGIPPIGHLTNTLANPSASNHTVRLLSRINQRLGAMGGSRKSESLHSKLYPRCPFLWHIPGPKFTLSAREAAPLLPLLTQQNAWLKVRYGHEFCDDSLRFEKHLPPLENEARRFLVARAPSAPPLIQGIIADYLAAH